jgi:WD40 repeat protein
VWSRETGALLFTLSGHSGAVTAVGRAGEYIATGDDEGALKLWSCAHGGLLRSLPGHGAAKKAAVRGLTLCRELLLTGGDDGTVKSWKLDSALEAERAARDTHPTAGAEVSGLLTF